MNMLEIKNISKSYSRRGKDITILDGIDLEVEKGSFNVIEGESGTGKTTLLEIVAGLISQDEGSVLYNQENDQIDITSLESDERSIIRRHDIAYMSQLQEVIPELTVSENIKLSDVFEKEVNETSDIQLSYLLERLGLTDIKDVYPDEISGGELRRLVVARTLYNSPKVILADEPTNDLDLSNREEIYSIFHDMSDKGITVIVATHDLELAKEADNRYLLKDGKLSRLAG